MYRLFVCVWIPKDITESIIRLQDELKQTNIKAKYIEKENIHITVTFIGNVNENEINYLKVKMKDSLENINEFHVNLEGLKLIPSENHARVIGVKVNGEEIKKLIKIVGNNLNGNFFEESKITLCRVKNIPDKMSLKNFIEKNRNVNIGLLHVKNISLVKSVLTKHGPKYETIYKIRLNENERKSFN